MKHSGSDQSQHNSKVSFEQDLWNQLSAIVQFNKRGVHTLSIFSQFCKQYCKVMQQFANGIQKCADILGKELNSSQSSFDTMTIAFSNMKLGLDKLVTHANQKAVIIMAEILEPVDHFNKSYSSQTADIIASTKQMWTALED